VGIPIRENADVEEFRLAWLIAKFYCWTDFQVIR
jgi:hypothetical protein